MTYIRCQYDLATETQETAHKEEKRAKIRGEKCRNRQEARGYAIRQENTQTPQQVGGVAEQKNKTIQWRCEYVCARV